MRVRRLTKHERWALVVLAGFALLYIVTIHWLPL